MTPTKKAKIQAEADKLISVCAQLGIRCDLFNAGSYRLSKAGKVVDYYPKSKKCFKHAEQEWEQVENIESFLKFEFK